MEEITRPLNIDSVIDNGPKAKFSTHMRVLLWKQFLTHKRNWKGVLCVCLSPFLLCMLLFLSQIVANQQVVVSIPNPPIYEMGYIPKCTPSIGGNGSCVTIGYGILGDDTPAWIEHTMRYVANKTDLIFGEDIKLLWQGNNMTEFSTYFINNTNMTQIAVLFCTGNLDPNGTLPLDCNNPLGLFNAATYILMYNETLVSTSWMNSPAMPFPTYPLAFNTKMMIDSGIIDAFNPNPSTAPEPYLQGITEQAFPEPPLRYLQGLDVVNADGFLYFFIAPIVVFMVFLSELAQEKDRRLRQGLIVVGVGHFAYYLSWILVAVVYSIILPTVLVCSGYIMQFELFLQVPFLLLFLLFFLFTLGMCFFALFVYTLVPSAKAANTVSYAILLVGLVLQMFLSQNSLLRFIYDTTNNFFEVTIINLLNLYPPFPFAKIWSDISSKAGNRFSSGQGKWIPGPGYSWGNLTVSYNGTNSLQDPYVIPSSLWSMLWFGFDVLIYIGLIWYTDHVISSNRGSADGYFFFLTPSYWRSFSCCKKNLRKARRTLGGHHSVIHQEDPTQNADTVLKEKNRVLDNIKNKVEVNGVRLVNVSKTYRKYACGCKSANDVHAVKNVYLEIDEGELLCLLGHNGAGKSTLISILTGILGGFEGRITINGLDIVQDKGDVKELIGVCPQFDILWDEMTAREHLYMFALIKGIEPSAIPATIDKLLKDVNLFHVGDHQAKTFSGGMKRRLSLAISTIGNPKIVFLDEPTTGMDPKNRRHVWELIKEMKKGKVVILTTHAMEEADVLSDRIAVIVDGQFKCIGTSLFLKNHFGEGYRLTLVVNPNDIEITKKLIASKIPSAVLLDESGGSMVFSVPVVKIQELNSFFRIIENKDDDEESEQIRKVVTDWGLSQTTLEEVFMRVTGKKEKRQRLSSVDLNKMKKK